MNKSAAHNCTPCKRSSAYSIFPAFLVAILPKCPFCVMAYTGAMTLCGADKLYPNAGGLAAYLSLALSLLVIVSIAFNFKGSKTILALLFVLAGTALLAFSQFVAISELNYYLGSVMIFVGIWINGSFAYFFRKFKSRKNLIINDSTKTILIK